METYFLVVTGGSGMRCLEAFTHLAAIGMMPGKEINVLSIDTDTNNGNKDLSEQIVERYNKVRGGVSQEAAHDSFFSAKLKLYKYAPEYGGNRANFNAIVSNPADSLEVRTRNEDLAGLFFDPAVREFSLAHGYRAQTHLGSMLMYHTILEAIREYNAEGREKTRPENRDLHDFLEEIQNAGNQARVFIMGSLFGGTGASSIPILPQAFQDAIKFSNPTYSIAGKFGAVLLSNYFTFKSADQNALKKQKVIADASRFAINSQAALKYYIADPTVRSRYTCLYHIGWPTQMADFNLPGEGSPVTGGGEQRNRSHVVELTTACAAWDFFFGQAKSRTNFGIVYRTVNFDEHFQFDFKDFFGPVQAKEFNLKMTAFYATAFLIHSEGGDIRVFTKKLNEVYSIHDYTDLDINEAIEINDYFKRFAFDLDRNSRSITPGWLQQVQSSTGDGDFLFVAEAFSQEYATLSEFDYGQMPKDAARHFTTPPRRFFGKKEGYRPSNRQYQRFTEIFGNTTIRPEQNLPTLAMRLLGRIHNTFMDLYKQDN